ncbi:MAG: dihydroxyacetone kinase subunit L [Clostridiales bacterium]|jgi:dihydroxyacetone kinase|nr:dihydroxyacetone kinase subunit L [Clostridiales bacterium]
MIDATSVKNSISAISKAMALNIDLLTKLDSEAGDGDLGISMKQGFSAAAETLASFEEEDVGKLLMKCSAVLNETSPSTLGTILSMGIFASGKALKGKTECSAIEAADAFDLGLQAIMKRSKSKPGEKTILDALIPAQNALREAALLGLSDSELLKAAAKAASEGCEKTKSMVSIHGRAAYYASNSIGRQDGGATAGKIIFEALSKSSREAI